MWGLGREEIAQGRGVREGPETLSRVRDRRKAESTGGGNQWLKVGEVREDAMSTQMADLETPPHPDTETKAFPAQDAGGRLGITLILSLGQGKSRSENEPSWNGKQTLAG